MPDLAAPQTQLIAIVLVAFLLVAVLRRIPVVGRIIDIGFALAMLGAIVLLVGQRERFDPYFAKLTGALYLDSQKVEGRETRIRLSPDGHFWARTTIDGVERRMLIDSGATVTALSSHTAAAAGLEVGNTPFPMVLQTANGAITAQTAEINDLKLGNIAARDLAVVVSPAFGRTDVLGMNFLSRLKSWRVEDNTLILVPHHPQEAA